jgi:serine/threonine-protein kinase
VALTVSSGPRSVRVPALTGLDLDEARNRLEASGLRLGSIDQRPGGRAGQVIDQSPLPGDLVNRDSPVNLTLGGGN